jgi:hypothetical protein
MQSEFLRTAKEKKIWNEYVHVSRTISNILQNYSFQFLLKK